MKIKPLMLLPPVAFAGLALMFFLGMQREDPDQLPTALAGKPAPAVVVTPLGDLPAFSDETLSDGEVKLVNFWASWCAPCRIEHPNLMQLAEAEGLSIYGVNYKDKPDAALGFLAELGDPYRAIGADESGRMGLNWGLYGVPETFVIDGEGRVVTRFAGPITERVLESTIRPALARAAGQ
ncbi:cytochrome c biogenesis protein CcmG, thiol:disulfide interchange protein DsbE [Pseudooceanicola antarcticus]|uniref:Cytochrome c biogenesis protein CcmG, thiol:disulfide interchange protein DsbE n=2 Tax=Pseudooceanicola antarcticus TaxID=1247613 RepID=A0A285J7I1_9RHOB|nr:DsbE family thiol:disulfide interchange protein [Pseudooceanicola antarcticus]SNY56275.1 cytochrome c biogenesis protein CcmG, thiol:disulfide interchange protein DsbE [Pseudooceanicola antarcticus]